MNNRMINFIDTENIIRCECGPWTALAETIIRRLKKLPYAINTNTGDMISKTAVLNGKIDIQCSNGLEIYSDEAVLVKYIKALPTIDTISTIKYGDNENETD